MHARSLCSGGSRARKPSPCLPHDRPVGSLLDEIVTASDRHRAGICGSLRNGVEQALTAFLDGLIATRSSRGSHLRSCDLPPLLEQSLTMVYRLLFLLFAEARGLVPLWNAIYRASYSIEALCEGSSGLVSLGESGRGYRRSLDSPMTDVARASSSARRLNGRLFSAAHAPLLEDAGIDDRAAATALRALSTRPARQAGRERLSFVDLGVEQLGTVYEHILDYDAQLGHPRSARRVTLRSGRGRRKATGTFYTPRPLTDFLIRRTLHPLVEHASPEAILRLRILDPAMGSGAFLVAACRYLATAYESALVQRGDLSAGDLNALAPPSNALPQFNGDALTCCRGRDRIWRS